MYVLAFTAKDYRAVLRCADFHSRSPALIRLVISLNKFMGVIMKTHLFSTHTDTQEKHLSGKYQLTNLSFIYV